MIQLFEKFYPEVVAIGRGVQSVGSPKFDLANLDTSLVGCSVDSTRSGYNQVWSRADGSLCCDA